MTNVALGVVVGDLARSADRQAARAAEYCCLDQSALLFWLADELRQLSVFAGEGLVMDEAFTTLDRARETLAAAIVEIDRVERMGSAGGL